MGLWDYRHLHIQTLTVNDNLAIVKASQISEEGRAPMSTESPRPTETFLDVPLLIICMHSNQTPGFTSLDSDRPVADHDDAKFVEIGSNALTTLPGMVKI